MGGLSLGWLGLAPKKWNKAASNFFTGSPEKHERVSNLRPDQEPLFEQLQAANMGPGAGGSFGQSADYYRDLMSDESRNFDQFAAPEMRRFNEDIIPGLAEQFAGMGSGGLSSSGFRNAGINAGTDLSERLGAIRAGLRQQGAAGLQNLGQMGLGNYSQDVMTQQGSPGFLQSIAPAVGTAAGAAFGGPAGAAFGNMASNWMGNAFGGTPVGQRSGPYGKNSQYNPGPTTPSFSSQLPNFQNRM